MFHSKQWHYSLHRDFQNCYSTRRSLTRFFKAPIPAPILHVHITLQSREFSIQNPILHTEDRELFEYYNSTHRRQGDLLEMHLCVFQATPVAPMTFQSFMTFQPSRQFYNVPVFPGNPPHSSILRLECIFYSSIGFQKTPPSTSWAITDITNIHSSKKGRCCDIGQDVKMTYFLE